MVPKVRSPRLATVLDAILTKLQAALQSRVTRLTGTLGLRLVRRVSAIASRWGNPAAAKWRQDRGFARFLTVIALNDPRSPRNTHTSP
jgi:hypothetical protein